MELPDLPRLAVALGIGLLAGLERGWSRRAEPEGRRVAGLRTFGLIGLLGGVCALLARALSPWILAASFAGLAGLFIASHLRSAPRDRGLTTEVAALLVFALGALAALGLELEAAMAAVVMTALLGFKPLLHGWLERIGPGELQAALKFLLISVVVLPSLPDRGFGPWGALNPREVWLMVVIIAGLSFSGYAAVKLLGARAGVTAASLLGGLVSSTAVTLALSHRQRVEPKLWRLHAAGIVLASGIMFPRVLLEVAAVNRDLLPRLAIPLAAAGAASLLAAGLMAARSDKAEAAGPAAELRNPLHLGVAILFGASIAVVTLAAVALRQWAGESGLYATAALAGIMDVDAVTLSMARLARSKISPEAGAQAILVAAAVNTVSKAVIALVIARGRVGALSAAALGAALAAGGAAYAIFC